MKTKILIGACLLTVCTYAQQKKIVADFTKLQVSSTLSVYIQKSDTPYVIADMDGIKADVNNGMLDLSYKRNSTKVTVGYTKLNQITIMDASSIKNNDTLYAD